MFRGNGGNSDVGTKDWLAQQSGTGMFLQGSPGPGKSTWALCSCMMQALAVDCPGGGVNFSLKGLRAEVCLPTALPAHREQAPH